MVSLLGMQRTKNLTDGEAIDFVKKRMSGDGVQSERRGFEQQWFAALAAYAGIPFVTSPDGGIMAPRQLRTRKEHYNANLILPKALRFQAKLDSINPRIEILPKTTSWADLQAVKTARIAHRHALEVVDFAEQRRRALEWAIKCGVGFLKICWNPNSGAPERLYLDSKRRVDIDAEYDDTLRTQREEDGMYSDVYPGELDCELVEPFQQWWDLTARGGGFKECAWAATNTLMSCEDIYDTYGVEVQPDRGDALKGAEMYREIAAFMAAGHTGVTPVTHRARVEDCANVKELFHRPTKRMPRGRRIVLIGGRLIPDGYNGDNPYVAVGFPLPFVRYICFPRESSFVGISLVEALRPSQRAYNLSRAHAMAMQKTVGYAPTYIEKGSGVKPVQVVGVPGNLIEYEKGTQPPVVGQPVSLPAYIGQNGQIAASEMDVISAQTDPAQSKLPGQIRSGVGISKVLEDNNLILAPTVKAMFRSDEAAGTMLLQLIGHFYREERLVTIMGDDGEVDPRALKGSDLRNHYKIQIKSQPGDLDSAEARDAKILHLVETGVLDPQNPEHATALLKSLSSHIGDEEFVNAALSQDNSENREIQMMLDQPGNPGRILPWFDPVSRSKILERKLNSREFDLLPPATQTALAKRWAGFVRMIEERAQKQAAAIAAANGGAAPKGEASQPALPARQGA